MNFNNRFFFWLFLSVAVFSFGSCFHTEDPGPLQISERQYPIVEFDRLEMGSTFIIKVEQGNFFSINVRGDRRNLDDLEVFKEGNTLIARFSKNSKRKHDTHINITMPELRAAIFSGTSQSTVSGFSGEEFDFYLSGASISQVQTSTSKAKLVISGASNLTFLGEGNEVKADISGASILNAFNYYSEKAVINASGSSRANVFVTEELKAVASGASVIFYRGNPDVDADVSGSSSVIED